MSNMSAETFSTCKLLDVRGLRVSFDAVDVLHGVDLTVHCGRIHALIGESGSGKSVLARSILGLAGRGARTTGSIRFLGRELVGLSEREYRAIRGADIGLVVQDAMSALNPMRTIGEQLVETIACRHPDFRSGASRLASLPVQDTEFPVISDIRIARHCYVSRQGLLGRRRPWDVLQDIDLQVRSGEVMGLVGESGCGKSTLARLALGLIEPTEGTVRFKNAPIPERDSAAWRAQRASMQMIHQDPYACFDPRLPIIEQVAEPLRHHRGLSKEAAAKAALEVLRAAGLPAHHAGRRPSVMSGGQLQRAAIARAVALEPALLVCDEPVASLDVSIQAQVLELLLQLRNRMKMAMLFVSHNLSVVRCICDRVTVMYLGRIVESGTVEAVFSRPLHPYTKLLMASTPGADAHVVRYYPKGAMPSPIDRPKGCVFASRCPLAEARCRTDVPPLRDDGSGHLAACFSGPSFLLHPEA